MASGPYFSPEGGGLVFAELFAELLDCKLLWPDGDCANAYSAITDELPKSAAEIRSVTRILLFTIFFSSSWALEYAPNVTGVLFATSPAPDRD